MFYKSSKRSCRFVFQTDTSNSSFIMSELQSAIVHKSLGRIPLEILTRAAKETVRKGGVGEGFVPHKPKLVKIHCL